ncbi:hypothetical protein [Clostridium sp. DL1XJH146]
MGLKKVKFITNIYFLVAILVSAYALLKTYYFDRIGLPEGVCPVDNNRPLMYLSIGLLVTYFIGTYFIEKKLKNEEEK